MGRIREFGESILEIGSWAEKNWKKGVMAILEGIRFFLRALGGFVK